MFQILLYVLVIQLEVNFAESCTIHAKYLGSSYELVLFGRYMSKLSCQLNIFLIDINIAINQGNVFLLAIIYRNPFFMGGNGFEPQSLQFWIDWQITTARNWYSQSLGYASEIEECNEECMQQSIITPESTINKPTIVITASNSSITCADKNLTGSDCDYYQCGMQASLTLTVNQSLLGNQVSTYVECPGICNHDFVWKQPDFIVEQIEYYIPLF